MASIQKHGDKWRVKWREGGRDAPARYASAPTRRVADELRRDIERQLALTGTYNPRAGAGAPRLDARLRAWLDTRAADLAPRTVTVYDAAIRQYAAYAGPGAGLGALTREHLAAFRSQLVAEGASPSTAYKRAATVLLAWTWLTEGPDARWLAEHAPRKLDGRRPRNPAPIDIPTWDDLDLLHGALVARHGPDDWRPRLALLVRYTGLRRGEAVLLRRADLELDVPAMRVRVTKGDLSARRVPLAPPLVAAVRTWEPTEYVIDGPERERQAARSEAHEESGHLVRGHADRDLRRAWATTGVRPEVWSGRPAHCARRTWTTYLPAAGADREAVEYLIGHAPTGTGPRYYADQERRLWPAMVAAVGMVPAVPLVTLAAGR